MKFQTRAIVAATLALAALGAQAHDLWFKPSSTVLSKSDWVTVDAAVSNDIFFFNHRPLAVDKLTITAPDGVICNATWPAPVSSATISAVWVVQNVALAALSRLAAKIGRAHV